MCLYGAGCNVRMRLKSPGRYRRLFPNWISKLIFDRISYHHNKQPSNQVTKWWINLLPTYIVCREWSSKYENSQLNSSWTSYIAINSLHGIWLPNVVIISGAHSSFENQYVRTCGAGIRMLVFRDSKSVVAWNLFRYGNVTGEIERVHGLPVIAEFRNSQLPTRQLIEFVRGSKWCVRAWNDLM